MRLAALWGHHQLLSLLTETQALLRRVTEVIEGEYSRRNPPGRHIDLGDYLRSLDSDGDRPLSPQLHQTLALLLGGDSEKQIAYKMKLSPHTVHFYVKTLYRRFDVHSRSELMAKLAGYHRG